MAILYHDYQDFYFYEYYANRLYNLFSKYSDKFSHEADTELITVDNKMFLKVYQSGSAGYQHMVIELVTSTGDRVLYWDTGVRSGSLPVQIFSSDDVLTFIINVSCVCFFAFRNDDVYFGYVGIDATNGIENMTIVDGVNLDTTFRIRKIADYQLSVRDLFFTEVCILSASGGDYVTVPDYCSCSKLAARSTYALQNKTYFAIGTNTLIEFTEES